MMPGMRFFSLVCIALGVLMAVGGADGFLWSKVSRPE
jgi:hypothetical protein